MLIRVHIHLSGHAYALHLCTHASLHGFSAGRTGTTGPHLGVWNLITNGNDTQSTAMLSYCLCAFKELLRLVLPLLAQ